LRSQVAGGRCQIKCEGDSGSGGERCGSDRYRETERQRQVTGGRCQIKCEGDSGSDRYRETGCRDRFRDRDRETDAETETQI
jgi:hypothetical protein